MAGGIRLPTAIPRPTIRAEGQRLGFVGVDLEDFVDIVAGTDDWHVRVESERLAKETRSNLDSMKTKKKP